MTTILTQCSRHKIAGAKILLPFSSIIGVNVGMLAGFPQILGLTEMANGLVTGIGQVCSLINFEMGLTELD